MIQPGEIYIADFDLGGRHPIIILSREELNRGRYVLAVVCTSARFAIRQTLPNCVPFRSGQFGFTSDCVAQCENVLSLDKAQIEFSSGPFGMLDEASLRDVVRAVGYVMNADCEPA